MTTQQEVLEFAPDADTAGYRLHELAVHNWGTFHGRPYVVRPDGRTAILTGGNGTGKSTLADALLTLLVPNRKRNYNQAGQTEKRSERNERDYVLGAYSEKHDAAIGTGRKQFLRKDTASYSVLLATFHNADLNSWVSLAQVLWVNSANKVEKAYITEPRRLAIDVEFNHLDTPATFRRILKDRGLTLHDSFAAYSDRFHDLLCMPKDKTPMEIFNQAICIKDIHDLTSFIREFMLDDGGAAERLAALRRNFAELRETNRRIEVATRQRDALNLMQTDHDMLMSLQQELDELKLREETLAPYFAEASIKLREALADRQATQKAKLSADQLAVERHMAELREKIASIRIELEGSEEGRRLKRIEEALKTLATDREVRKSARQRFEATLQDWKTGMRVFDASSFAEIREGCARRAPELQERLSAIEDVAIPRKKSEKFGLAQKQTELETEERSLLSRTSNIPDRNLQARAFILEKLGLKPADLPFVGELVQVKPEEAAWTGAVERLAHGFALCLVVRRELREQVDAFVHAHRQRGLVVYHAVPETIGAANPRLSNESVAHKLEIKSGLGEIGRWLEVEIGHRFDHIACVDTGSAFQQAANAITINGLIKQKGSERRKDDRGDIADARNYVLGWDNREKLTAITKELKGLREGLAKLDRELQQLEEERKSLRKRISAGEKLTTLYTDFAEIDWESVAKAIDELEAERKRIQSGSNRLKQLESEKAAAESQLKVAGEQEKSLIGQLAVLSREIDSNTTELSGARELVATCERAAESEPRFAEFRSRYRAITDSLAFPLTDLGKLSEAREDAQRAIVSRRRTVRDDFDKRSQRIRQQMYEFQRAAENEEFKDRLAGDFSIPGYNERLWEPFAAIRQQILGEDLPKNLHRFESLLHSTITDDVSVFDSLLESHATRIVSKIEELNEQLRQIDFDRREKTFIQLVPSRAEEGVVREFRHRRRQALQDSLNATTDREALKERYHRIEMLLIWLDEDPLRTLRVIDVRNWFVFRADEFYRESGEHRQSYSGASGKSGGEKNRLASTILATAIAYQYGISVRNRQTETFRLVAVDEMFSKTDDEFSAYLLELFKEFHLQLLIIQPLDAKIHLVQKYVERYHIVTKRGEHSAVHTLSVQEYNTLRAGA